MSLQYIFKDSRVNSGNTIGVISADSDKRIALAVEPYCYQKNRFSEGENAQQSDNQTKSISKLWEQKFNYLLCKNDVHESPLQGDLGLSSAADFNFASKGHENGHNSLYIPVNSNGSKSKSPSEHISKLNNIVFKSDWNSGLPMKKKAKNGGKKEKTDEEAIVDLAANKHNRFNHTIHDYLWCPFVMFFVFFCCTPAFMFMHRSDIAFRKQRDAEARRWAICSSVFYGIGLVLTLAFYAMIFTLVFIFCKYELYLIN